MAQVNKPVSPFNTNLFHMINRLIHQGIKQYLEMRLKRLEATFHAPEVIQEKVLADLLRNARDTEFGRKYGFGSLKNADDFKNTLPVHSYDALKNYINRMMHGERNVLCPGAVRWYSKSSGTTNDKSKYLPVPIANLYNSHISGTWYGLATLYRNRPNLNLFSGKTLIVPGSHSAFPAYPQTRFGDVSAVTAQHTPSFIRQCYLPDMKTVLDQDFEKKLEHIAQLTYHRNDIILLGGCPTWVVVLFRRILELAGKQHILEIWPNFQAFMHGGVGFDPYRDLFRDFIPDEKAAFHEIYNASEGYFAVQWDTKQRDMVMLLDNSIYYEFAPEGEWHKEHPRTVGIGEVEVGKDYAIYITSNNGLFRYKIGDTVCFTRLYPHCIRVTGRTQQFINAFGEEVMVGDAEKALTQTCQAMNAAVADYTAGPVYFDNAYEGRGGHEWVVEFERAPQNMERFAQLLDKNLQQINSDYEAKRFKDLALVPLCLRHVPKGTFRCWLRTRGQVSGQTKVPRLANHRNFVEGVLETVKLNNKL